MDPRVKPAGDESDAPRRSREISAADGREPVRVHIIGGADAARLVLYFFLEALQTNLPVAPVSLPLPALHFCDPGQKQLVGIAFSGGLGEAFTLLLQQVLKRARLGLAAL